MARNSCGALKRSREPQKCRPDFGSRGRSPHQKNLLIIPERLANLILAWRRRSRHAFCRSLGDWLRRQFGEAFGIVEGNIQFSFATPMRWTAIKSVQIEDDGGERDQPQINKIFDSHRILVAEGQFAPTSF